MILSDSDKNRVEYEKKRDALVAACKKAQECKGQMRTISLSKKSSNLFRNREKDESNKLDVKQLNKVIHIDPEKMIAEVEGMIPYEDLVNATLKYNCLPPVVPELKTITVGGALVGLGIESSSFRYGLMHETVLEIEVLTGDGRLLICRPDNEHRDLFHAFPNSYGTLGYALKVTLKLIPAKPFIRLTHLRFHEPIGYFTALNDLCSEKSSITYIDGTIFKQDELYITLGEFVDEAPYTSDYTYMQSYYRSISNRSSDFLTTHDYIWRWDSDWFWCSKHFGMHHKLLRFLFGKWMLCSKSYWKIKRLFASNPLLKLLRKWISKRTEAVIQDILIPVHNAPQFLEFFQSTINISPIWVCPTRSNPSLLCPLDPSTLHIDFGFWDTVPSTRSPGFFNRLIEEKTTALSGFKSLYSDTFYTPDQFWQIYPKSAYTALKAKYDPQSALKDLPTKCLHS